MALTPIQEVRLAVQDNTPGLYIISDEEVQYFLDKNNGSIVRASLDAAKVILLNLSMRGDSTVDILSIRGSKAAEQYRLALQLFIRDPYLNPVLSTVNIYAGNISKEDYNNNELNADNIYVASPTSNVVNSTTDSNNPFSV